MVRTEGCSPSLVILSRTFKDDFHTTIITPAGRGMPNSWCGVVNKNGKTLNYLQAVRRQDRPGHLYSMSS